MNRTLILILFLIFSSCVDQKTKQHKPDYDKDLIDEYNQIHRDDRFILAQNSDTLKLAIQSMDKIIEKEPEFIPAYYSKYDYQCRIGNKKGAINTLKKIVKYEKDNLTTYFHLAMIYEQVGLSDSSQYYLELSNEEYGKRCEKGNCSKEDQLNILYQKLYQGELNEGQALDKLKDITTKAEYDFYAPFLQDFNRDEFLKSHCQKIVTDQEN